jgi:hypothetical protein
MGLSLRRTPEWARLAGQSPRLSAQEVQDIVAFLRTLTDGLVP